MTSNNDKKVLNVPALRFPEFSGEWIHKTIDEIFELRNGYTPSKANQSFWNNGTIPWFRMEDIRLNGGILYDAIQHITPEAVKGSGLFEPYSIILATTATIGEHAMIIADSLANQQFTNFKVRKSLSLRYAPYYLYYYFFRIDKWCLKNTNAGGLLSVDIPSLKRKPIYAPLIDEQIKIAKLLRLIDERIATQNKIIEKYESLIKGINCKIFALIQGNEYRLGDIATITNGNSNVQDASVEYRVGLYPFFDRSEDVKYLPTFLFDKESIIYPGEGTEFMPRYYNGKFALHQRCYAICDFNEAVNPQFLYFFLKTQNSYFIRNAVGSTVPSLRLDTFQKLKVVIPSKETQYSVYSFLSTLEQKLDVENSIMKMLLCQKRYLLRQMFI